MRWTKALVSGIAANRTVLHSCKTNVAAIGCEGHVKMSSSGWGRRG